MSVLGLKILSQASFNQVYFQEQTKKTVSLANGKMSDTNVRRYILDCRTALGELILGLFSYTRWRH